MSGWCNPCHVELCYPEAEELDSVLGCTESDAARLDPHMKNLHRARGHCSEYK